MFVTYCCPELLTNIIPTGLSQAAGPQLSLSWNIEAIYVPELPGSLESAPLQYGVFFLEF